MESQRQWSPRVAELLRAAGWYEGRRVEEAQLDAWRRVLEAFTPNDAALSILAEFGCLRIDQQGPGVERARMSFWIDPARAVGEDDRFAQFEEISGPLFPVGEAWGGHGILGVSAEERVFVVIDDLYFVGSDFAQALDSLVEGRLPLAEWSG